ncbi:hypothetical protein EF294_19375 [Gordonia oryzae]|uniref:Uncharacterized protein n=1 Tax=Gordonia oryzae TaxID=2487349 RepID=A0A3N4G2L4_9ACTN|nr:hypothetical protein EF294_19375 [Gordonia oryzae]
MRRKQTHEPIVVGDLTAITFAVIGSSPSQPDVATFGRVTCVLNTRRHLANSHRQQQPPH